MPIPPFTIDGVLPPYVGPNGPGGSPTDMSPYAVGAAEVVASLGLNDQRKAILRGWLNHRAALRAIGFTQGFQWLDGSFVEQKNPQDLDVVTFLYRPQAAPTAAALAALMRANLGLFGRAQVRAAYKLDFIAIDLNGTSEALVSSTRYWFGLFSHRRGDELWKGMLQVRLEDAAEDLAALTALGPPPNAASAGAKP